MKRGKVKGRPGHYVYRKSDGTFAKWVNIGRSLRADRRKKVSAKNIPRDEYGRPLSGYGHRGDYPTDLERFPPLSKVRKKRGR